MFTFNSTITTLMHQSITALLQHIPNHHIANAAISKGSVGWHIDHCLRVINSIAAVASSSNPAEYNPTVNFAKLYVLTTGHIPKGRKAPSRVTTSEAVTIQSLEALTTRLQESVSLFENLHPNQHFPHPYFGSLNKKGAVRFITIHNKHHLAIINIILQKKVV